MVCYDTYNKLYSYLSTSKNIVRQIKDIQVQADRLIKNNADVTEIEDFAKYSQELKTFLIQNIKDDFILNYLHDIPVLDLDEQSEITESFLYSLLHFFGGALGIYSSELKKKANALDKIRDIKSKYASVEFMLKNYFQV